MTFALILLAIVLIGAFLDAWRRHRNVIFFDCAMYHGRDETFRMPFIHDYQAEVEILSNTMYNFTRRPMGREG